VDEVDLDVAIGLMVSRETPDLVSVLGAKSQEYPKEILAGQERLTVRLQPLLAIICSTA
jgi:hypothetical protein